MKIAVRYQSRGGNTRAMAEVIHDPSVANTTRNRVTIRRDCAQNIFGAKVDFT